MFRPTPALQGTIRRLPLSVKQAGKEYYKGNRVGSMGTINRFGNFSPDWEKIRTYVFPVHGTKNAEVRLHPTHPAHILLHTHSCANTRPPTPSLTRNANVFPCS